MNHVTDGDIVTLRFTVDDTGQGLKPEDQKLLFSEYKRFNVEANRTTEGTGLGLNITQKLVQMMDGVISVKSEYGKGSSFSFTIKQKAVECDTIGAELVRQLCNFTYKDDIQASKIQITRVLMPYGKVLIVDDVDTNLFVAEGLMSPYKLNIETAISGFVAIDKVKSGKTYDIIFMDHMMPQMDGIETTEKLRASGYTGVIVALTANALAGNDKVFAEKGFDGFISKPIDVVHLNIVLNKFIRDRHPKEAAQYSQTQAVTEQAKSASVNPKLLEVFRQDAIKAAATLRTTSANGDIKLFTTTAHAMKSALANIGENEKSASAFALEKAGHNGDTEFIAANTGAFIETLEALIEKLKPAPAAAPDDTGVAEDTVFLTEQLVVLKTACTDYDDTAAYAALDRLKEKSWKAETTAVLDSIHSALFLHSDFEEAEKQIQMLLAREENNGN